MLSTIRTLFSNWIGGTRAGQWLQARSELSYWKRRVAVEGALGHGHYEVSFTRHVGVSRDRYRDARVLDIGCGPRGSLEWASEARERVGLDPLAQEYLRLGADKHAMRYVEGSAEHIPFADGHFDIVSSFNSLHSVRDLVASAKEIARVTRDGGLFLLVTKVNHVPSPNIPQHYGWDVVNHFTPYFRVAHETKVELVGGGAFQSLDANQPFDTSRGRDRLGVLAVQFVKQPS